MPMRVKKNGMKSTPGGSRAEWDALPLGTLGDADSWHRRRWLIFWLILGGISLPIDLSLAQYFLLGTLPEELYLLLERAETFGHAYGVLAIAVTVGIVDRAHRSRAARLFFGAIAGGLLADAIKITVLRTRPRYHELGESIWQSFQGLWGWNTADSWSLMADKTQQSFPSAHTATAVGLAVGLATIYPHARKWFYTLAVLVACNRIFGGAHFLSDCCVGAAIGWATADWAASDHRTTVWMDWIMARWWGVPPRSPSHSNSWRALELDDTQDWPEQRAAG